MATLSLEGGIRGGDFHYSVLPVFWGFFTTKYVMFYSWICVHIDKTTDGLSQRHHEGDYNRLKSCKYIRIKCHMTLNWATFVLLLNVHGHKLLDFIDERLGEISWK